MAPVRVRRPRSRIVAALFGVAALGLVIAYGAYRRDLGAAEARVAAASTVTLTPCGPIEYASFGTGPALLLVHGAGGGYDQALDAAHALAARGYRTITMSRFGYLRTPLPTDAGPAAQADAHACLLDALGVKSAGIVGASAGAPSAVQFALRHPARTNGLVLLVPALYVPTGQPTSGVRGTRLTQFLFDTALRADALFWVATKVARRTVTHALLATPARDLQAATPDERARADAMLDHVLPVSARRQGLVNDAAIVSTLPRYDLERIATPTLVISVEDDLFGTYAMARYTAEHVSGARFVGFPTGGHLWVGHHAEVLAQLADHFRAGTAAPQGNAP